MGFDPRKLEFLRKKNGLTFKTLSQMTGISLSYLNAMEKGSRPGPSFNNVERLANAFQVPIAFFREGLVNESTVEYSSGTELLELTPLYDEETLEFLRASHSKPYIDFARRLSDLDKVSDSAELLALVADFMKARYAGKSNDVPSHSNDNK